MKIALVGNTDFCIYNYRFELCQELLKRGHEVLVISPYGDYVGEMISSGCRFIEIKVNAHGTRPIQDLLLKRNLKKIFKREKPDYVCGFTIKPNIYGAWACRQLKIPFIANITGLGPSVENKGIIQTISIILYKIAFKNIYCVFCQNSDNKKFFEDRNIAKGKIELIPGSGVNLEKFKLQPYPSSDIIKFGFISRVRKDKGIDEFIEAARSVRKEYPNTEFHVWGKCDDDYLWIKDEPNIIYHGFVKDTTAIYKDLHCVVFPSHYAEGMANVLLEACASGRPVITTDRAGCREVVDDGVSGYLIKRASLTEVMNLFLMKSFKEQKQMGLNGRLLAEKTFNRNIIVINYLNKVSYEKVCNI